MGVAAAGLGSKAATAAATGLVFLVVSVAAGVVDGSEGAASAGVGVSAAAAVSAGASGVDTTAAASVGAASAGASGVDTSVGVVEADGVSGAGCVGVSGAGAAAGAGFATSADVDFVGRALGKLIWPSSLPPFSTTIVPNDTSPFTRPVEQIFIILAIGYLDEKGKIGGTSRAGGRDGTASIAECSRVSRWMLASIEAEKSTPCIVTDSSKSGCRTRWEVRGSCHPPTNRHLNAIVHSPRGVDIRMR